MVAVAVDALVDRAHRTLDPELPQDRDGPAERSPRLLREQHHGDNERGDHEPELDPQVGADVVVADRQDEAHSGECERRRAAERTFEQHRPGDRTALPRVAAGRLEDAHPVAADRRRQDLPGRVRGEVRAHQPAQPVEDPACREQLLPAPGHRPDGDDHDRDRPEEVGEVRVAEDVERLPYVDLPDDVGGAEAGDDEGRADPDRAAPHREVNEACTRRSASIASSMSASEWAGDSGSDRSSAPARSVTGSGGWSGNISR